MDRLREFKKTRNPFTSEAARFKRAEKTELRRREQREKNIAQRREIKLDEKLNDTLTDEEETANNILEKLKKWKEEKALKKKLNAKNKKPVFKIGIPHHNFYSPTSKDDKPHCHHNKKNKNVADNKPKKITKATERRLALKAAAAAASTATSSSSSSQSTATTESGKTPIARCTRARKKAAAAAATAATAAAEIVTLKKKEISIAPKNYEFKNPVGIDSMPLFGRFKIPIEPDTPKEKIDKFQFTFSTETNENSVKNELDVTPKDNNQNQEIINDNYELKIKNKSEPIDTSILPVSSQESLDCNENKIDEKIIINNKHLNIQEKCSSPVAAQFSPFITTSRGKSSSRKEYKKRMSLRTSCSPADENIPTKETVMKNLNITIDEEEHTAQYYRSLGEREANRLKQLCNDWRKIQYLPDTPEESIHHINSAIGQAELLLNKKFGRFQQLVNNCEDGKGEMLVRCRDLEGFWELVSRETADCDSRFLKLDKLKNNNWTEEEEEADNLNQQILQKKIVNKKKNIVKKKQNTGKSQMKLFIEAQRKKKLQEQNGDKNIENNENIINDNKIQSTPKKTLLSSEPFVPSSPMLTPKNLNRRSLTDSAKKMALASMKITQIYKTPDFKLDKSISYVNSHQTPAKSILKKIKYKLPISEKSNTKSTCKVNFNDTIDAKELPIDDDDDDNDDLPVVNFDKDVSIVLEKIDSINISSIKNNDEADDNEIAHLEKKKLIFDDSDLSEDNKKSTNELIKSDDESTDIQTSIPSIKITSPSPMTQRNCPITDTINSTPDKKLIKKKNNKKNDSIEVIDIPRQLRNRSIKIDVSKTDIIGKENIIEKKKIIKK